MSSVPTAADNRSKRPVKKRALDPVSAQAASVDALFAKPDQEIRVPSATTSTRRNGTGAPPEIISNVQGSSSGAGSGEFHVYKASRRREYARLRTLEEEAQRDKDVVDFEEAKRERELKDGDKTRRNREKRERAKARKAKSRAVGGPDPSRTGTAQVPLSTDADNGGGANETAGVSSTAAKQTTTSVPTSFEAEPGLLIHDDDD